jgi:hypothetical protein
MKNEIIKNIESEVTKEHLIGETLLPNNVKTSEEVNDWILSLNDDSHNNNNMIVEQVVIYNKQRSWFSVYEVSIDINDVKYVIDVLYKDIWNRIVNETEDKIKIEVNKRKLINGLLLNPAILKTKLLSVGEFNKQTKETLSRLSLNNDYYVNQNLIIDSKSVLLSNNEVCPYIYFEFKFENRKDKKEKSNKKLFFRNNYLMFDLI